MQLLGYSYSASPSLPYNGPSSSLQLQSWLISCVCRMLSSSVVTATIRMIRGPYFLAKSNISLLFFDYANQQFLLPKGGSGVVVIIVLLGVNEIRSAGRDVEKTGADALLQILPVQSAGAG